MRCNAKVHAGSGCWKRALREAFERNTKPVGGSGLLWSWVSQLELKVAAEVSLKFNKNYDVIGKNILLYSDMSCDRLYYGRNPSFGIKFYLFKQRNARWKHRKLTFMLKASGVSVRATELWLWGSYSAIIWGNYSPIIQSPHFGSWGAERTRPGRYRAAHVMRATDFNSNTATFNNT